MIKQKIIEYLDSKGISKYKFYQDTGISNGFLDKDGAISSDKCEIIFSHYPDLNIEWLILGKGNMIKTGKEYKHIISNVKHMKTPDSLNDISHENLIPYYDVDFAAGALELYNDPSQVSYYLDVPEFTGCTAFKVYGDSMYPKIANGTMVFAKKLSQWDEHIEYGRIYGVVCRDGRKFIKYIRKNRKDPKNSFVLSSENESYDDFEVKHTNIHNIWMIHGWVVKIV